MESGKEILALSIKSKLLVPIINLCDDTRHEGLNGNTQLKKWTYNGMLREFSRTVEGKGIHTTSGELMKQNAEKNNLLEWIEELTKKTHNIGIEKRITMDNQWGMEGLLPSLGNEIEKIIGSKYPEKRSVAYYTELEERISKEAEKYK